MWERSGSASKLRKELRPSAIIHIDANVMPDDILEQLDPAMRDKIYFIYTGKDPLEHPDLLELIDQLKEDSMKLHLFLPDLLSMGIETLLARVPPSVVKEMKDILPKPNDKRAAQVFFSYDNVFNFCKDAIVRFELEAPPLFDSEDVDRTALLSHKKVRQYNFFIRLRSSKKALYITLSGLSIVSLCPADLLNLFLSTYFGQ